VERVAPIVGLASHLGRGVQRIATDVVVGRVRSLPRTIGDLDATALSHIMGRTVTSVAVIGGDAGTSSRARPALTGDGVPESVFVKMPAETRREGPIHRRQLPGGRTAHRRASSTSATAGRVCWTGRPCGAATVSLLEKSL
jgi:hypothetical protein